MITTHFDDFGLEYVTIENDGHFTTMLKSTYEAMQAEQSTPSVIDEA